MIEGEQILIEMNKGFAGVHERLGRIESSAATRHTGCLERFAGIEQDMAVKQATNGIKEKIHEKKEIKQDWVKAKKVAFETWLVRTALGCIIVGVITLIGKLLLGHIDVIVK
jgi:preprotein translocase subunit Sss1